MASGINVDASGFHNSIMNMFQDFTRETEIKVEQVVEKKSKDLNSELKNRSSKFKLSGEYAKGWKVKKQGNIYRHYNGGKNASLSHILENGTIQRSYKSKFGKIHNTGVIKASPHIDPAYQKIKMELDQDLKKI